ncbi:indole-3-glycerol phosphate synthase TrpC [Fictibacillus sp. Mic-4]|uniref:indole-3-glycerol phosphate synthase TrpC n=1 Tax=Fictibacillus TaxID=1329200 RepID=UPI0003F5EAAC|nr:indole-3-glycerol phosphate synthase TrpC [Fictibacillus gelatini]
MLQQILEQKKREIDELPRQFKRVPGKKRSLIQAIQNGNRKPALIAEVKKASPSKGIIKENFVPVDIAVSYEKAGADAISVLTDERFFQGSNHYLTEIKKAVALPILRKDFIIDERQVEESSSIGADAILLIAAALSPKKLHALYKMAQELGLECLVEIHSAKELYDCLHEFTPKLIGINNRDLTTFQTSIKTTETIIQHVPEGCLCISESGIHKPEDIQFISDCRAHGILVGEALMRARSPQEGIKALYGEN